MVRMNILQEKFSIKFKQVFHSSLSKTTDMDRIRGARTQRAVALLFVLSAGVILLLLAASLFTLYSSNAYSHSQQQAALQAYWNARAAVERYSDARQLPGNGHYDFGSAGNCTVVQQGQDLVFRGQSASQYRQIILLKGDPAARVESAI